MRAESTKNQLFSRVERTMRISSLGFVGLTLLALLGAVTPAPAQTGNSPSADSLAEVLKLLTGPTESGLPTSGSPAAADIDREVQALAGSPELAQEVYALAGQVL